MSFSTTEWYSQSGIVDGIVWVKTKTADDLNALAEPPPNPFTATATATMTNDEGETASGTFTFQTSYAKQKKTSSTPSGPAPTPNHSTRNGVPGILHSHKLSDSFNNAGTNPRFTEVTFDKPEYLDVPTSGQIVGPSEADSESRFFVRAKTHAQLRALFSPPPSPFTVKATAAMTNDEGHTATVTVTFTTNYATQIADLPLSKTPSPSTVDVVKMPPRTTKSVDADSLFDNSGTNPRFTAVVLSTREYYDAAGIPQSGNWAGEYVVKAKSVADLKAMDSLPANPIRVTATVTMINDEGATGTRTVTFETAYEEEEEEEEEEETDSDSTTEADTPAADPTEMTIASGSNASIDARVVFDDQHAKFTSVELSTGKYYGRTRFYYDKRLFWIWVKTDEQLAALPSPPYSPFWVTATVKGSAFDRSYEATVKIKTTYVGGEPPPQVVATPGQFSVDGLSPLSVGLASLFSNMGTNARFTDVTFDKPEYLVGTRSGVNASNGTLDFWFESRTNLSTLSSPPSEPFTVTGTLTMTDDERGQTATSTATVTVKEWRADKQ